MTNGYMYNGHVHDGTESYFYVVCNFLETYYTGPVSIVVKASAMGSGGRRFKSQCPRQWFRSEMAGW